MKTLSQAAALLVILTLMGCGSRSQPGGGQNRSDEFTIRGPATTPSIPEGGTEVISVSLSRGNGFEDDVKLQFSAPTGVEVAPKETTVTSAQKNDIDVRVVVGKNVAVGDHVIRVTGQPEHGKSTSLDIKFKVTEASSSNNNVSLKLRGPSTKTTLKQGESETIPISLEPNSKYQAHVTLKIEQSPGLKAEFANNATVKAAEGSEAKLRITADRDAKVGEHTIRITGDGSSATVTALDVKVNVVAK